MRAVIVQAITEIVLTAQACADRYEMPGLVLLTREVWVTSAPHVSKQLCSQTSRLLLAGTALCGQFSPYARVRDNWARHALAQDRGPRYMCASAPPLLPPHIISFQVTVVRNDSDVTFCKYSPVIKYYALIQPPSANFYSLSYVIRVVNSGRRFDD